MLAVDKESDDLVYRHFYSLGHHGLSDVRMQLIDKVNDKDDLLAKEGQWVYRLRSLKPDGLMRVTSFLATIEGNVAVGKNFYCILSVIHIISVRLLSFGKRVLLGTFRSDYDYEYEYEYEFFNVYPVRMPDCVRLSRQLVLSSKSRRRLDSNYEILNKSRPPTTSLLQVQRRVKGLVFKGTDTL